MPPALESCKKHPALERWIEAFVRESRRLYDALPGASKRRLSYFSDFRAPCLIVVFWAPQLEYLYILVVKEPEIKEDSSNVYELSPTEAMISQAAAALEEDWFHSVAEPARSKLDKKYKDMMRNHLLGVLKNFPQARLRFPPKELGRTPILQKGPDDGCYFEWTLLGNVLASSPAGLAANVLSEAVRHRGVGQPPEYGQANTPLPISPSPATRPGFISAFSPGCSKRYNTHAKVYDNLLNIQIRMKLPTLMRQSATKS